MGPNIHVLLPWRILTGITRVGLERVVGFYNCFDSLEVRIKLSAGEPWVDE